MRQIAARLGLSPSTVSRALSDHPRISASTKARVRQAVMEMSRARPVGSALSCCGLFLTGVNDDPFFSYVVKGTMRYGEEAGLHILLERLDGTGRCLPYALVQQRVEGMIVGGLPIQEACINNLLATQIPVVFIGRYLGRERSATLSAVISDNVSGGRMAARHLIDSGYAPLLALLPPVGGNPYLDRLEGFCQVAREEEVPVIVVSPPSREMAALIQAALAALAKALSTSPRVGLFTMSDRLAATLLHHLERRGLRVPEQVGVVGYDGLDVAAHVRPSLTTIDVPKEELGYQAARLLHDLTLGRVRPPVQLYLQPRLVSRESTVGSVPE